MKRTAIHLLITGLLVSVWSFAENSDSLSVKQLADSSIIISQKTLPKAELSAQKDSSGKDTVIKTLQIPDRSNTFLLRGRVIDAETGLPVSYATIGINQLGIGSASNLDGEWSLRIPPAGASLKLSISLMGYTTQVLNVANLSEFTTIHLVPSNFQLAEVVVRPGDFVAELLSKAYKAIPDNYPTKPTLCQGFYRETQRVNDTLFLYFDEAALDVYKNTYKNVRNFGQIKIEKSRKNVFPGIDSINNVRFYGGPHFPNDLDIVFSRWDFIKPSEYKNWIYEYVGVFKDSLSEIYTITFRNRKMPNSNFQGRIFIDKNSMAYVGFELERAGLDPLSDQTLSTSEAYVPGNTNIKIGYTEQRGIYNLSYITYKTSGVNTSSKIRTFKDIEYITTGIKTDSVSPIPFDQQFDYTDILSIKADNYDQSYWKDYNILQESKLMGAQTDQLYKEGQAIQELSKVYNKEITKEDKVLIFLKRFTFESAVGYNPISYRGGVHHISYGNASGSASVSSQSFGISTLDGTRFELTKKISIFSNMSTTLYGMSQFDFDLGMNYRFSLAPSGRWIFLDLGLAASTVNSKFDICSIDNPDKNLQIGSTNLKSSTIDVKAAESGLGAKPIINLSVRLGKKYELFVKSSYFLPFIYNHKYLQFKETSGFFLNRKSAKVDWTDHSNLNFTVDGVTVTEPRFDVKPYVFSFGIRSGF